MEIRGRPVQIVGVDPRSYRRGTARPERLADSAADLRILLCHFPQVIDRLEPGVFDLVLSGHLHAGQITVPYPRGRLRLAHMRWTYVEGAVRAAGWLAASTPQGLGGKFVPFRVFARPAAYELVLRRALPARGLSRRSALRGAQAAAGGPPYLSRYERDPRLCCASTHHAPAASLALKCPPRIRGVTTRLRGLTGATLPSVPTVCHDCVFWQSRPGRTTSKRKWIERAEDNWGAWGTVYADNNGRVLGSMQYGPSELFPRADTLPAGRGDEDAVLITCAYLVVR